MDLDEDGFSARSRLLELLDEYETLRNNKKIVEFCTSQPAYAHDLLHIIIDQIIEVASLMKWRSDLICSF